MFACIECAGRVEVQEVLLQLLSVFLCSGEWQCRGPIWWWGSGGAGARSQGRLGVADWLVLGGVALGGWCCCWRLYPLCSASPWSASSLMALLLAWGGMVIVVNDSLPVTLTIMNCISS